MIKYFTLLLLTGLSIRAGAQLRSVSLEERVNHASVVFEGRVISQVATWNSGHTHIYTVNKIEVFRLFKGAPAITQVELVTRGGIVGNDMEQLSDNLELKVGDTGTFTAVASPFDLPLPAAERLRAYAGLQGFIRYDLSAGTAKDPFTVYDNGTAGVYATISKITGAPVRTIRSFTLTRQ